jgi:hypothetical protein
MGLTGQGSNPSFPENLAAVTKRIAVHRTLPTVPQRPPEGSRRPWGAVTEAVVTVLGSADELRMCDVHKAVEVLLGEPVPRSTVKNCLAGKSVGNARRFERVGWGRYRLVQ